MSKPAVADTKPIVVNPAPGSHFWCACGLSKGQPYCDGSHQGGPFSPVKFEIAEQKPVALCMCKQTQSPPFCDGTHSKID